MAQRALPRKSTVLALKFELVFVSNDGQLEFVDNLAGDGEDCPERSNVHKWQVSTNINCSQISMKMEGGSLCNVRQRRRGRFPGSRLSWP